MTCTANSCDDFTVLCNRAQSEVVGVVILVAVFALLGLLVGTVIIGNVTDQAGGEPLVDINAAAINESGTLNVTLTHAGGDNLHVADVDVILRQDDERREGLASYNGSGDTFTPGEIRWKLQPSLAADEPIRVIVVHEPSNAVVFDATVDAR